MFRLIIALSLVAVINAMPSCGPGTFQKKDACEKCPPGTYQNEKNAKNCKPCPPGTYFPFEGGVAEDVCLPCTPGTFNADKGSTTSSACKPCPRDLNSGLGAEKCISCNPGTRVATCPFGDLVGRRCLDCPFPNGGCFQAPAKTQCFPCNEFENEFNPDQNSRECQVCPVGSMPSKDGGSCVKCRFPGCAPCGNFQIPTSEMDPTTSSPKFSGLQKYEFCRACKGGSVGNKEKGATKCRLCPSGTARQEQDLGGCKQCEPGENTGVRGAHVCVKDGDDCPRAFFRNNQGACIRCSVEERFDPRRKVCVACEGQSDSRGGMDQRCRPCKPGERVMFGRGCTCTRGWGLDEKGECKICEEGFEGPFGQRCFQCSIGSFAPRKGMERCLECPNGTVQPNFGQKNCKSCPSGLVASNAMNSPYYRSECVDPATNCPPGLARIYNDKGRFIGCEADRDT